MCECHIIHYALAGLLLLYITIGSTVIRLYQTVAAGATWINGRAEHQLKENWSR